jgi:hypothetical protein
MKRMRDDGLLMSCKGKYTPNGQAGEL